MYEPFQAYKESETAKGETPITGKFHLHIDVKSHGLENKGGSWIETVLRDDKTGKDTKNQGYPPVRARVIK